MFTATSGVTAAFVPMVGTVEVSAAGTLRAMLWPALAMMLGGVLWVPFGVFEMIAPFGIASVYQDDLKYEVITDPVLHLVYGIPGALALMLTAFGLGATAPRSGGLSAVGRVLAYVILAAGVLSGVGLAIGLAPLFVTPIGLGTPVLGLAAVLIATGRDERRALLLAVGVLGLSNLPLRPLVYAVGIIPPVAGAAIIGLFGLSWLALGWVTLRRER